MRQQNNLEQLYRERYKNLETTPREDLWANIAARLPEKETKRRIIPLWYRIAGAAAVIALLSIIGMQLFNPINNTVTRIVYIESRQDSNNYDLRLEEFEQTMTKASEMLTAIRENTSGSKIEKHSVSPSEKVRDRRDHINNSSGNSEGLIAGIPEENTSGSKIEKRTVSPLENIQDRRDQTSSISNNSEGLIAGIPEDENLKAEKIELPVLPETEVASLENDSKEMPLLPIEEKLAAEKDLKNSLGKRFLVKTTAAAVYFDNLGKGNSIDNQFAGNDGAGELSFSYGVAVAYKISEKLSIRSGINKVDLSYNTRDVAYSSALNAMAVDGGEARAVSLASPVTGYLNQRLGFVEVPVELKYGIINKKIGLNIIGGASTLFLNENNVTLEAGNASTSFGEAANLNDVSFSTNVGMGIDYNLSPQLQINLEPIFKYQLNTFNNTSDVKPYYFGIYSGISFKF